MIRCYLVCILFELVNCWGNSQLSTFRTEALNIKNPIGCNSTFEEAAWIMRSYFIFKNRYNNDDWTSLTAEYRNYKDSDTAISQFLDRFGDPYTRFIPEKAMTAKMRNTRGETIGVGIRLRRRIYLLEVGEGIRQRVVNLSKQLSLQATRARFRNFRTMNMIRRNGDSKLNRQHLSFDIFSNLRRSLSTLRSRKSTSDKRHNSRQTIDTSGEHSHTHTQPLNSSTAESGASTVDSAWSSSSLHYTPWPSKVSLMLEFTAPLLWACLLLPFTSKSWRPTIGVTGVFFSGKLMIQHFAPIEVTYVSPNSPCSVGGVAVGDKLLAVGGQHVWRLSIKKLQELLDDGPIGQEISLSLKRKLKLSDRYNKSSDNLSHKSKTSVFTRRNSQSQSSFSSSSQSSPGQLSSSSSSSASLPSYYNRSIPIEVSVVRGWMPYCAVTSRILSPGLGYIAITEFTDKTAVEVSESLSQLRTNMLQKYKGQLNALVLDLRGNPGGTLKSALDVAALFLSHRKVLLQMLHQGRTEQHVSLNRRADMTTELLLLMDGRTASASEILVAALRDNQRATTMGATTVGKDVAQATCGWDCSRLPSESILHNTGPATVGWLRSQLEVRRVVGITILYKGSNADYSDGDGLQLDVVTTTETCLHVSQHELYKHAITTAASLIPYTEKKPTAWLLAIDLANQG